MSILFQKLLNFPQSNSSYVEYKKSHPDGFLSEEDTSILLGKYPALMYSALFDDTAGRIKIDIFNKVYLEIPIIKFFFSTSIIYNYREIIKIFSKINPLSDNCLNKYYEEVLTALDKKGFNFNMQISVSKKAGYSYNPFKLTNVIKLDSEVASNRWETLIQKDEYDNHAVILFFKNSLDEILSAVTPSLATKTLEAYLADEKIKYLMESKHF